MKTLTFISAAVLCFTLGTAVAQTDTQPSTPTIEQARQASKNNPTLALGMLEAIIGDATAANSGHDFGRAQGPYWQIIVQKQDFPRALDFYSSLAARFPENPDVLAAKGSAIGGYLAWASMGKLASNARLQELDSEARRCFNKALELQPESFSGLYGFAMYESYAPNGKQHAKELAAKLDSLRGNYAGYPWQLVDELEARLAK